MTDEKQNYTIQTIEKQNKNFPMTLNGKSQNQFFRLPTFTKTIFLIKLIFNVDNPNSITFFE